MRARKYREKIIIKQSGRKDIETWANVRTLGGFKYQNLGLLEFKNPMIFTIRNRKGLEINEKMTILFRSRTFIIQNYEFNQHDEDLKILGVEYES